MRVARWHAEQAWLPGGVAADVLLEAAGGRWARVQPGAVAPPDALRLRGLTLPGLANVHSHAFHRLLRGRTHEAGGDFWRWRDLMYEVAAMLDPDRYETVATAVYAEMALAGITSVGEFHYLHHAPSGRPYAEPNAMADALVSGAAAAGIRVTLLDACYLHGGFGTPVAGPQRRFADPDVHAWGERAGALADALAGARRARVGAAIHSVRAVDAQAMAVVAQWAAARGAPLHVHVSEQPAENDDCLAATGRTPVALLADAGALGRATTAVHATHLTAGDVGRLGGSGTAVCLCPTTERDLADGVGPARSLADAGSPLCLGTDSHAVVDVFEEARAVELDERLATLRRGHHRPADLLEAMTTTGQRALGWDVALRPGALADATTIRLDSPRTAGAADASVPAAAVFAATAADVEHVVVDGSPVVAGGRHLGVPEVGSSLRRAVRDLLPG